MHYLSQALIVLFSLFATALCAADPAKSIISHSVKADYSDVYDSLTSAIMGRGLSIAHVIDAKTVLAASEDRFGNGKPVFSSAQNIEFCSASLSHQLIRETPDYLVLCPFAISIYELSQQPGRVHLVYRNPEMMTAPGAPGAVLSRVKALFDDVIAEGTQWFPGAPQDGAGP